MWHALSQSENRNLALKVVILVLNLQDQKKELDEILAKRAKTGKKTEEKTIEEKTTLHSTFSYALKFAMLAGYLGDNCIQNFHLGTYIVGNLLLRRRASGAVKPDFQPYTSQIKILNMVIPILMRLYSLVSSWSFASRIKPHVVVRHQTKCDIINGIKLFLTVYIRIYCCKFLTLSNQKTRYKSKCIRNCLFVHHTLFVSKLTKNYLSSGLD